MVPGLVLSLWAGYRVRSTYSKWQKVDSSISMNAFDFARYLLNSQGLNQVSVEPTPATLTARNAPRTRTRHITNSVATAARQTFMPGMGRGSMGAPTGAP